jgi:hypothetical protein
MNTKSLNTFAAAFAVLLTLLGAASVRAGTITLVTLPGTNTDIATGITTNKTYVSCFDYGNRNTTVYSVNGVPFAHVATAVNNVFPLTNWIDPASGVWNSGGQILGGEVFVSVSTNSAANDKGVDVTSSAPPGIQADGNTLNMLYDQIYPGNGQPVNGWLQEVYSNLVAGNEYSLRIYWRVQTLNSTTRLINVWFNGEGTPQPAPGNPISFDTNTVTHFSGAEYLNYDFIASGTTVSVVMTNAPGGATTFFSTLEDESTNYAPFITSQASVAGIGNGIYQFGVTAIGTAPVTYQWYTNSVNSYSGAAPTSDAGPYIGSTSNILTTTSLTPTNALVNYYFVVVGNNEGYATSSIVRPSVIASIATQSSPTNEGNAYVAFGITAGGFLPLSYQWYINTVSNYSGATALANGAGVSGATTNTLQTSVNLNDYYFVIVTNLFGSATSSITSYNPLPGVTNISSFRTGNNVGLTVAAVGWPTLQYQWYINTVSNYTGASALNNGSGVSGAQTASVTVNNPSAYYFVVVTNIYGATTSQVSVLDSSQETVIGAGIPIWNPANNQTNVIVYFSDFVDPVTAATAGNYLLSGGSVSSAAVTGSNEVVLTTSTLSGSQTLTVSGVEDYYEIPMVPSPTNLTVGLYPANLALWVRANAANVTGDGFGSGGIYQWNDLSGNGNTLYGIDEQNAEPADPVFTTNAWGDPVVRFTATNESQMSAFPISANLEIASQNSAAISIFAVVNFTTLNGGSNGHIVSITGNSPTANLNIPAPFDYYVGAADASLYRGNGGSGGDGTSYGQYSAPTGPSAGVPHVLAVTEYGNTVSHFLDGNLVGTGVLNGSFPVANIVYEGNPLFIGTRADNNAFLTGDLAELIIAGSTISSYDVTQLTSYLAQVHNLVLPGTSPVSLSASQAGGQLTLSWPTNYTGWILQSQTDSVSAGIGTNWVNVGNSTETNVLIIPISTANGCVFYRLIYAP